MEQNWNIHEYSFTHVPRISGKQGSKVKENSFFFLFLSFLLICSQNMAFGSMVMKIYILIQTFCKKFPFSLEMPFDPYQGLECPPRFSDLIR